MIYDTIEEFNVDSKAECGQSHVASEIKFLANYMNDLHLVLSTANERNYSDE